MIVDRCMHTGMHIFLNMRAYVCNTYDVQVRARWRAYERTTARREGVRA
jgi:hypothetical protein